MANPERETQLDFHLQNISLMEKIKDILAKNYSRLRVVEQGENMNWAAIYVENLKNRVVTAVTKGRPTIVHAHLRALAAATPKDEKISNNIRR